MFTVKGFVEFLELLPVLAVVEAHPRRRQYKKAKICKQCKGLITASKRRVFCSTECHNFYWLHNQKPKPKPKIGTCALCKKEFERSKQLKYCSAECRVEAIKQRSTANDYSVERNCIVCKNTLPYGKATYCSDECQKEQALANNRNPFSDYGNKSDEWSPLDHHSVPVHSLAPDILAEAEAYAEDYPSGIREDMDEINRIIMEENHTHPARYKKTFRSPEESGKLYWSVKQHKNNRREKAGLPKLPSMRTSNLEYDLVKQEKRKKRNSVTAIREKNYQTQKNNTAFATIGYEPRTKSGKLKSEILADVKRKQSMGST